MVIKWLREVWCREARSQGEEILHCALFSGNLINRLYVREYSAQITRATTGAVLLSSSATSLPIISYTHTHTLTDSHTCSLLAEPNCLPSLNEWANNTGAEERFKII